MSRFELGQRQHAVVRMPPLPAEAASGAENRPAGLGGSLARAFLAPARYLGSLRR
jgi:hypothetical protein